MMEIAKFIEAAIEHTLYLAPTDVGLTLEELLEAGKRHGLREGEIKDGLRIAEVGRQFGDPRIFPKLTLGGPLHDFLIPLNPEYRDFVAFDFVCRVFREHARDVGVADARFTRAVVVERAVIEGIARQSVETAVTILTAMGHLSKEKDGTLALRGAVSRVPSEEARHGFHYQVQEDDVRKQLFPTVKDIIARRGDGRPASAEPLDAFANLLEPLGYGPFRMWWKQTVDELRRSDENQNSVAVCVLAAALVEGALTFVVKHARSLSLGVFGSTDFDGSPTRWSIEKLVGSAAASGGKEAIFDAPLKVRVDTLVITRQRIHAGRMLVEHPKGVPDLKPEEARDAKITAELAVRRILEWVQAHPGRESQDGAP